MKSEVYCCHICSSQEAEPGLFRSHLFLRHGIQRDQVHQYAKSTLAYTTLPSCLFCSFKHISLEQVTKHQVCCSRRPMGRSFSPKRNSNRNVKPAHQINYEKLHEFRENRERYYNVRDRSLRNEVRELRSEVLKLSDKIDRTPSVISNDKSPIRKVDSGLAVTDEEEGVGVVDILSPPTSPSTSISADVSESRNIFDIESRNIFDINDRNMFDTSVESLETTVGAKPLQKNSDISFSDFETTTANIDESLSVSTEQDSRKDKVKIAESASEFGLHCYQKHIKQLMDTEEINSPRPLSQGDTSESGVDEKQSSEENESKRNREAVRWFATVKRSKHYCEKLQSEMDSRKDDEYQVKFTPRLSGILLDLRTDFRDVHYRVFVERQLSPGWYEVQSVKESKFFGWAFLAGNQAHPQHWTLSPLLCEPNRTHPYWAHVHTILGRPAVCWGVISFSDLLAIGYYVLKASEEFGAHLTPTLQCRIEFREEGLFLEE